MTNELRDIIISCIKEGLDAHERRAEKLTTSKPQRYNVDCLTPSELLQFFTENHIDDSWIIVANCDNEVELYRDVEVPASDEQKKKYLYDSGQLYNRIHSVLIDVVKLGICMWRPNDYNAYKRLLASDLYTDIKSENYSNILNYFENRIKLN